MLKKDKLRYNEYFDMQSIFDELYQQSRNNNNFYKLMEVIGSKQNIRLAYRNLKGNTGSKTKGTDGKTIEDISKLNDEMLIKEVRARLEDYNPLPVRRVYIPKPGSDKKRPLGIPTIWDRLIQQCILQVLEPICEPKFHNHSYGFRPNRSTHHAVSRMVSLINLGKHYYCVDIDIKGFFDNVNHGKLMKQIWNLGIRDKRLLCIISKLLKCEIEGEGIKPKERNGTDDYSNIVIVSKAVIPLIEDKNADYCSNLSEKQKVKLNRLRRARKLKPVKGTCKLA